MIIADKISDYKVLDTGDGMKLESWGGYLLARPDPQVIWKKSRPALWEKAHAVYHRSATGGGHWEYKKQLPERWEIVFMSAPQVLSILACSPSNRPTGSL